MKPTVVDKELHSMLVECTGVALCDSGGAYGRNWEHNQGRTIADFMAEEPVTLHCDDEGNVEYYTISVFHYLRLQLEVDEICWAFNRLNRKAQDWDDDRFHGVSLKAGKFLDKYHVTVQDGFNSYNGEDFLSQVIQGTYVRIADNGYVILQIHGGCDVRGGYTNARLFRIVNDWGDGECDWLDPQHIYGVFTPNGADLQTPALIEGIDIAESAGVIRFDNCYNGYDLTDEHGTAVVLNQNAGKIDVWLPEY